MSSNELGIFKVIKYFRSQKSIFILLMIVFLSSLGIYLSFQPVNEDYSSYGTINDKLDFQVNLFSNKTISLSDYHGKLILLDFFATWCYPCKLQVPILRSIHNQFPEVQIISVSVEKNDTYNDLATYKAENGPINWLYGKDAGVNGVLTSLTKYKIQGFPFMVFINKNGAISHMHLGDTSATEITSWIKRDTLSYVSVVLYGFEINSSLSFILFFLIGLYIALSPCLFPIMPLTIMNILRKDNKFNMENTDQENSILDTRSIIYIIPLWAGIVVSFGIFMITSSIFSLFLIQNYLILNFIFGLTMILLGIVMVIPSLESKLSQIDLSNKILTKFQQGEFKNIDLFLLGSTYAIIAFPCAAPAILAMLPLLLGTANPIVTITSLLAFSIGVFIPYFFVGKITTYSSSSFLKNMRNGYKCVKIFTSIFIIIIGLLLAWPYLGGPSLLTFS